MKRRNFFEMLGLGFLSTSALSTVATEAPKTPESIFETRKKWYLEMLKSGAMTPNEAMNEIRKSYGFPIN